MEDLKLENKIDLEFKESNSVNPKKDSIIEEPYKKVLSEINLVKVTPEDRKKQIEIRKAKIIKTSENVLSNADSCAGGLSYIIFGLACTYLSKGEYLNALVFFSFAIISAIMKYRIPEGPLSLWLRKPISQIVIDVKKTIAGNK